MLQSPVGGVLEDLFVPGFAADARPETEQASGEPEQSRQLIQ